MKYSFFLGIMCSVFSIFLLADNSYSGEIVSCPKTYVRMDQLDLIEDKIFVRTESSVLQIPALHSDQVGLFFESRYKYDNCGGLEKACRVCGLCIWRWSSLCRGCNEPQ